MALLAFSSAPNVPTAIAELLSPRQRLKTAGELNAAILESFSHGKEAKLVALIKLLCWGESMLSEKADFPKVSVFHVLNGGDEDLTAIPSLTSGTVVLHGHKAMTL